MSVNFSLFQFPAILLIGAILAGSWQLLKTGDEQENMSSHSEEVDKGPSSQSGMSSSLVVEPPAEPSSSVALSAGQVGCDRSLSSNLEMMMIKVSLLQYDVQISSMQASQAAEESPQTLSSAVVPAGPSQSAASSASAADEGRRKPRGKDVRPRRRRTYQVLLTFHFANLRQPLLPAGTCSRRRGPLRLPPVQAETSRAQRRGAYGPAHSGGTWQRGVANFIFFFSSL